MVDAADTKGRNRTVIEEVANDQKTVSEEIGLALGLLPNTIKEKIEKTKYEVSIVDVQWDPFEDNLIVSFADGSLSLISFQGLDTNTQVVQTFERQANQFSNVIWTKDKSGNFLTANKK